MSQLWGRREFVRIASLGPLGLGLGDYLSLRAQSQKQPDRSCIMVVRVELHVERVMMRHAAVEDSRHVQVDTHEYFRNPDLRASAQGGNADGQVCDPALCLGQDGDPLQRRLFSD